MSRAPGLVRGLAAGLQKNLSENLSRGLVGSDGGGVVISPSDPAEPPPTFFNVVYGPDNVVFGADNVIYTP